MDEAIIKAARRSTFLSRIVAVFICVLLVLFLGVSVASRNQANAELEEMKDGPYPVSVAAGHIETLLVSLKTLTAYPDILFSEDTAESLRQNFEEVNRSALNSLDVISAHPLDESGDQVMELRKQYRRLMTYQSLLINMITQSDTSSEQVSNFIESRINPQIDRLLRTDTQVLEASTQAVEDTYNSVTDTIHTNMLISYVFMAAVVAAVAVYLIIVNRKTRREEELRDRLNDALVQAQAANEAKSVFLANMSHELRTPMNAIMGLTSIMRMHTGDPKRLEECLDRLSLSSEQLLTLINELLELTNSGRPVSPHEVLAMPEANPDEVAESQPENTVKKLQGRVLVVEDNEINSEIATELISNLGPAVEVARDGLEAVERMKEVQAGYYDLIFMDWQMPRMNGIEATEAIIAYEKERGIPHTPIVAMTANSFTEDREATAAAGMDGFMPKPINVAELKANLIAFLPENNR